MLDTEQIKKLVGIKAVDLVMPGMTIGIGSGSTVFHFITALAVKVREGLICKAVPTSLQTFNLAKEQGISLIQLNEVPVIDLAIDGADETDHHLQLIKGGGGALLQEKMVAAAANKFVVIADNSKMKDKLGQVPLPLEVVPYGWKQVAFRVEQHYNVQSSLRMKEGKPFISDHGHYILDCYFPVIDDAAGLNSSLHLIPGVVETGLFIDMCDEVIIGYPDGTVHCFQ
jgi:ribose 5-phosphate isomerase A